MGTMMKLKDAVGTPNHEIGVFNDYVWFVWHARNFGKIRIGKVEIKTHKEKGKWFVDDSEMLKAFESFKVANAEEKNRSKLMPENPRKIIPEPKIADFRLVSNIYDVARKRSDGTWYCNTCNLPAETEHNNPECHTCSDWHSCGKDCTLSKVYCLKCGKSLEINIR
jgi:hypothetical protein